MVGLARIELGMVVAIFLPPVLPILARYYSLSLLFTATYGGYAIFPASTGWKSWALWIVTTIAGAGRILATTALPAVELTGPHKREPLAVQLRREPRELREMVVTRATARNLIRLGMTVLLVGITILLLYGSAFGHIVRSLIDNDRAGLGLSGLLAATFVAQLVVVPVVRPFAEALSAANQNLDDLGHTSAYIGWVERAVVYAFVAAGQPSAAALAITAKALVRIPEIPGRPKEFVEYVLIGTFTSLLTALTIASFVRLSLGHSPI